MDTRYLSIHRVVGIIGLPDETDVELLPSIGSNARALLTVKKEPYYLHMRRCSAFGAMLGSALMPSQPNPMPSQHVPDPRARFDAALSQICLRDSTSIPEGLHFDKPLLVIDVSGTAENVKAENISNLDLGDFGFGMELFEQAPFAERAKEALEASTAGLLLAMPHDITATIEPLGSVAYLIESETKKLLYSLSPSISGSMSSHSSLTESIFADATAYARNLRKEPSLEAVVRLLSQSAQAPNSLQAFLTAWAGLEVFLDKTFKETYEQQIYTRLRKAVVPSEVPFIERLHEVNKGKYNVRHKFVVVASALDEHNADSDIRLFKTIKETRDGIHQMNLVNCHLPTDDVRNLLRKYLRLHLRTKATSTFS